MYFKCLCTRLVYFFVFSLAAQVTEIYLTPFVKNEKNVFR